MKRLLPSLLALLIAGCARHDAPPPAVALPSVAVRVATVRASDSAQLIDVTGTIRPVRRAVIAAKVMGSITELPVTLGQRVRANDVLLRIAAAEAKARLAQAVSQLNVTRRDLERERDLQAKGASTAETVRTLQDRFAGAEALVREAEAQLGYTELRAPFDGIVARKLVNLGDLASPGQALLELEESAAFEVEASIPDSLASSLTPGAVFACEAGGTRFQAALREVSSAADPASHAIGVILTVPPGTAVRSGQFTRIQVPGSIGRTILAPASAVSLNGQIERVFVVAEGSRAQLRLVKTGSRQTIGNESWQEILSGLSPDERVVIDPPSGLRDGQPLEVRP